MDSAFIFVSLSKVEYIASEMLFFCCYFNDVYINAVVAAAVFELPFLLTPFTWVSFPPRHKRVLRGEGSGGYEVKNSLKSELTSCHAYNGSRFLNFIKKFKTKC